MQKLARLIVKLGKTVPLEKLHNLAELIHLVKTVM